LYKRYDIISLVLFSCSREGALAWISYLSFYNTRDIFSLSREREMLSLLFERDDDLMGKEI
jgi:hypothetical protein